MIMQFDDEAVVVYEGTHFMKLTYMASTREDIRIEKCVFMSLCKSGCIKPMIVDENDR